MSDELALTLTSLLVSLFAALAASAGVGFFFQIGIFHNVMQPNKGKILLGTPA